MHTCRIGGNKTGNKERKERYKTQGMRTIKKQEYNGKTIKQENKQ